VARSSARVLDRLREVSACDGGPVRLDIGTHALWPVAAGIALRLERAGYDVRVDRGWPLLFGDQARATGREACVVTVAAPGTGREAPVATVDSDWGRAAVGVEAG
jgi:hypothetical protein